MEDQKTKMKERFKRILAQHSGSEEAEVPSGEVHEAAPQEEEEQHHEAPQAEPDKKRERLKKILHALKA